MNKETLEALLRVQKEALRGIKEERQAEGVLTADSYIWLEAAVDFSIALYEEMEGEL